MYYSPFSSVKKDPGRIISCSRSQRKKEVNLNTMGSGYKALALSPTSGIK